MSRYLCAYIVKTPLSDLEDLLKQLLKSCNFEIIYHTLDYMMAKEIPGKVSFSKLVTVEVLVDSTTAVKNQVQVNLIVKNDELPLQVNNHCHQLFEQIQKLIAQDYQWHEVDNAPE